MLTEYDLLRYGRQIMLFGEDAQRRLKATRLFVAGAGGLGSPLCTYLAVAGIGGLRIADFDKAEFSNLNRQILHWDEDLGKLASGNILRALREAERVASQEAETAKQVSDFLIGLFEVSDPSEAKGETITAREILTRGAERVEKSLAQQPEVQGAMLDVLGIGG